MLRESESVLKHACLHPRVAVNGDYLLDFNV